MITKIDDTQIHHWTNIDLHSSYLNSDTSFANQIEFVSSKTDY